MQKTDSACRDSTRRSRPAYNVNTSRWQQLLLQGCKGSLRRRFVEAAANGKAGPYLLLHGGARGRAYLPSRRKVPSSGNTNAAPLVLCCTGNSCVKGNVGPVWPSSDQMGLVVEWLQKNVDYQRSAAHFAVQHSLSPIACPHGSPLIRLCFDTYSGTVLPREKSWEHMGSMLTVQFGSQDAADTMRVLGRAAGAFGFTIGFSTSGRKPKVGHFSRLKHVCAEMGDT